MRGIADGKGPSRFVPVGSHIIRSAKYTCRQRIGQKDRKKKEHVTAAIVDEPFRVEENLCRKKRRRVTRNPPHTTTAFPKDNRLTLQACLEAPFLNLRPHGSETLTRVGPNLPRNSLSVDVEDWGWVFRSCEGRTVEPIGSLRRPQDVHSFQGVGSRRVESQKLCKLRFELSPL